MTGDETPWQWIQSHKILEAAAVMLLVGVVGLIRWDQVSSVSYRRVPVVSVQQVPGGDLPARAVTVDLGDRQRLVRTGDWMIQAEPGEPVCIAERALVLRRFTRISLALPGYCGRLPPAQPIPGLTAS
ncbi:MAG: hypothetical protein KDK53_02960 [Maritimibacter sp.]|nr:hypothetical protein [Maritimibacter sp.]